MRFVIIGDGIAGQTVAQELRKASPDSDITILTEENVGYYSRIYLPHYIAGEKTLEQLILRKPEWYNKQRIDLFTGVSIERINREEHLVHATRGRGEIIVVGYDKLFLTVGSHPRRLPFGNENVKGVFTLRNVKDADSITGFIKERRVKRALIIGGGLLGIELGYHLRELNIKITICEIFPYLLPRQLDKDSSSLLQKYLESQGLGIVCGEEIEKILGDEYVTGVRLKSGMEMEFDIIFQQMGIIPNTELAKSAGLETNRGIVVNEYMQTTDKDMQTADKDIYAAGDCIEFNGRIWGIIPASMEQAKLAVKHALGKEVEPYTGTIWNTRLKIAGIDLSCYGEPPSNAEEGDLIYENVKPDQNLCRKVILTDDSRLKSAILIGKSNDKFFRENIGKKVDEEKLKEEIHS